MSNNNYNWIITDYGIDKLWQQSYGEGVKIAVIDTGLNYNQVNIAGNNNIEYYNIFLKSSSREDCLDVDGHGTKCAGMIAALGPDVFGIAPKANLLVIKATVAGSMACKDLATAITAAVDLGAQIISVSYVFFDNDPDIALLTAAVNKAVAAKVLIVASTGDSGALALFPSDTYPASYQTSVGVGANDQAGNFWTGTTLNTNTDILAPGCNVPLIGLDNNVPLTDTGTSFSAPFIAGIFALLVSILKTNDFSSLLAGLKQSAVNKASMQNQIQAFYNDPTLIAPDLGIINILPYTTNNLSQLS